jgi:hypothetical protein
MSVEAARGGGRAVPRTYALLTDGSTVEIRPAGPADAEAVRAMHAGMSSENLYLRFFSMSPHNAEVTKPLAAAVLDQAEVVRLIRAAGPESPCAGRGRPDPGRPGAAARPVPATAPMTRIPPEGWYGQAGGRLETKVGRNQKRPG